jgi:hypothetical protein
MKLRLLVATALVATCVGALVPAAHAEDLGAGAVVFAGTASLPQFPCPGGCGGGTFDGLAVGAGAGLSGSTPVSAVFPAGAMTADFSYNEPCGVTGEPLSGNAAGDFTVAGGVGVLPTPGASATATGDFTWQRRGLLAVVKTHVKVEVCCPQQSIIVHDTAVAAFAPHGLPGPCNAGTQMNALVVGVDVLTPVEIPIPPLPEI